MMEEGGRLPASCGVKIIQRNRSEEEIRRLNPGEERVRAVRSLRKIVRLQRLVCVC